MRKVPLAFWMAMSAAAGAQTLPQRAPDGRLGDARAGADVGQPVAAEPLGGTGSRPLGGPGYREFGGLSAPPRAPSASASSAFVHRDDPTSFQDLVERFAARLAPPGTSNPK